MKIAIIGLGYVGLHLAHKPNVDDMRESPTFILLELLKKAGQK